MLLLLEWLHTAHRAAQSEWWGPLRCTNPSLPWPTPPAPLTRAQRALVQLPVRVLWRQADGATTDWLHAQADKEAASSSSSDAFFPVHAQLCRVKSSHIRLLLRAIDALVASL